ncbi:hypothetical protein ACX93W_26690 [Paenibacillus sp. CAU 1782]
MNWDIPRNLLDEDVGRPLGWIKEPIDCGELVEVNGEYVPAGES